MGFYSELKRRNVFRVAMFYAVSAWLLLQVGDVLAGLFGLPDWTLRFVGLLLLLGFPITLILSWVYELTPEGVKREKDLDPTAPRITGETGRKLDVATIAVGVIAIGLVAWQQFGGRTPADSPAAPSDIPAQTSRPQGAPAAPATDRAARTAIAVLPFANLSGDESSLPFTQGLHDDLLTRLSRIGGLDVVSRTSVLEYAQTTKNVRTIAGELGVSHIMEGGIQRAGDRVRINVQLIDARDDRHLWADTYDRELTVQNIFDLQSAIANKIADELRITLKTPAAELMTRTTDNVAAYEAYLRGKVEMETSDYGPDSTQRAIDHFQRALELDPDFAAAWADLGEALDQRYWFQGRKPADRDAVARAVQQALALDPDLPEAHFANGIHLYHGFLDYPGAMAAMERAREGMGGEARFLLTEAAIVRRSGDNDRAIGLFEQSARVNPRNPGVFLDLMFSYKAAGRYDDAGAVLTRLANLATDPVRLEGEWAVLEWEKNGQADKLVEFLQGKPSLHDDFQFLGVHASLGAVWSTGDARVMEAVLDWQSRHGLLSASNAVLARAHYLDEAGRASMRPELQAALASQQAAIAELGIDTPIVPLRVAHTLALLGRTDEALAMMDQARLAYWIARDRAFANEIWRDVAIVYATAGQPEIALEAVARAMDTYPRGSLSLRAMMADPQLAPLTDHPNFQPILARHGWTYPDRSQGVNLPGT